MATKKIKLGDGDGPSGDKHLHRDSTAVLTTDDPAPEVKKIPGFVPKGRVMRCNLPLDPEEGAEAGWFDLRGPVSIEEVDILQTMLNTSGTTYEAFWERICPRIVAWNAVAFDLATGEYQPVPPPSEGGHDSFRVVDPALTVLTAAAIVNKVLGRGDQTRPKASGPTPAPASGGD